MSRRSKAIQDAIAGMEPALAKAFLTAIADLRSSAQVALVTGHLERGDIEAAITALHIDAEFFAPLDDALRQAFVQGGATTLRMLTGLKDPRTAGPLVIRFDRGNPRPERWLREHSATLIREITDGQRNAIREVLVAGMAAGKNPRATALDIVGRVNRVTGKREGGLIGLTAAQMQIAANARSELEAGSTAYFDRKLRDRNFDRRVRKAIAEGRALTKLDVDQIVGRYHDRLLKARGDSIARTESMASFGASQMEAARQAMEKGGLDPSQVKKIWRSAGDGRVRDSHRLLNGVEMDVDGLFRSPETGALMAYPGDTEHGAHGRDTVNCRCWQEIKVNFLSQIRLKAA